MWFVLQTTAASIMDSVDITFEVANSAVEVRRDTETFVMVSIPASDTSENSIFFSLYLNNR